MSITLNSDSPPPPYSPHENRSAEINNYSQLTIKVDNDIEIITRITLRLHPSNLGAAHKQVALNIQGEARRLKTVRRILQTFTTFRLHKSYRRTRDILRMMSGGQLLT